MTAIVEQAREVWEAKRERMTREDWMLLADALIEGKRWCKAHSGKPHNYGGDKGFGRWCREEGFGSVPYRDRHAALQVAEKYREDYLLSHNGIVKHPKAFLAGVNKQRVIDLGQQLKATAVAWLGQHPASTAEEIAEGIGVDADTVRKKASGWFRAGVVSKDTNEDGTVTFSLGRMEPVKQTSITVEDRLILEAASAEKPVATYILGKVAEDMYWLNEMLARELNDGTLLMPQVEVEEQRERFVAWLDSFYSASGRVRTEKADDGVSLTTKGYKTAPLSLRFDLVQGE